MVCEWGMSRKLGPLVYGRKESEVFLGRDFSQAPEYSENTAEEIDHEVRNLVLEQYQRAHKLLEENLEALKRVARGLLDYETLEGEEIKHILAGHTVTREKPLSKIMTRENLDKERLMPASIPEPVSEAKPVISV